MHPGRVQDGKAKQASWQTRLAHAQDAAEEKYQALQGELDSKVGLLCTAASRDCKEQMLLIAKRWHGTKSKISEGLRHSYGIPTKSPESKSTPDLKADRAGPGKVWFELSCRPLRRHMVCISPPLRLSRSRV